MKQKTIEGYPLLLKVIVGSQAYGTNTPESDIDYKGIYMQPVEEILLGKYKPQINVTDDEVYYEIGRFLELLKKNNPTIIEMLNIPEDCVEYKHEILDELFENRDKFLTKMCKHSFGGYAVAQIKKAKGLNKKMNWEKADMVRKTPLDFSYIYVGNEKTIPLKKWLSSEGYPQEKLGLTKINNVPNSFAVYYNLEHDYRGICAVKDGEVIGNELRLSSIPKSEKSIALLSYNENGYKRHCKRYKEYTHWLNTRNTARYVDNDGHGQGYDSKNMLHSRRLIKMGLEIAQGDGVIVRRPDAQELLDIRKGKVNLEKLIKDSEEDIKLMDKAYENSNLPKKVDESLVENILNGIRKYQMEKEFGEVYYLKKLSNIDGK